MRKNLLLAFLLACTLPAFAQYEYLAAAGALAGINALKGHPQKPDEYVTQASYQGRTFPQKRTPSNKVPGKGGPQITAVEQQLATCFAALQADATGPVMATGHEAALTTALSDLTTARPLWSTTAYAAELDFYRREDNSRQYNRVALAQQQAAQRQARERTRRDSLERLAIRRSALIDSTRRAVLAELRAQADSVTLTQASTREAARVDAPDAPVEAQSYAAPAVHSSLAHKPAVRKVVVKVKLTTGPTVYYCASGNTVKYHASPTCRGLSRCGASVLPISMREATQSMDPCKWCY